MPALLLVMLLTVPLSGCASSNWVTLRKTPKNPLAQPLSLLSWGGPKPTERTVLLLRRYDMEGDLKGDTNQLLCKLREVINREPSADKLYSLAELAYLNGKKAEMTNQGQALELHGAAILHSYLYLFEERYRRLRNPYDPEFRGACDLYNGALEGALRIVKKQGALQPGYTTTIKTANQTMEVTIVVRGQGWQAEDFDHFEFVSDYEINGLKNQYHTYGMGVPLIAVRKKNPTQTTSDRYFPPGLSFPVTAFLRLMPNEDPNATKHVALLELWDPLTASETMVGTRRVPLESDLSTPLAFCLSRKELSHLDLATAGLLHPDETLKAKGLYMLEPYQSGKIPVLMVHGLWSSPSTWMEMFNDLRSDPQIRSRYQFWFYFYPSGQPFWYSAAQLREDLAQMRYTLDPQHRETSLDQMVLVGHSMGGLISKLQTVDSGENFWHIVSDQPFQQIKATQETRETLARSFFFRSNPSVRRVITIGTPHRGSKVASNTVRYLGSKLITLPTMLVNSQKQLVKDNPGAFRDTSVLEVSTSIDSLSPSCPFLPVLLQAPEPPWVKYHNIVGVIPDKGFLGRVAGGTDGVVAFTSSHLDNVASELQVEADHLSIHRNSKTVFEVRRILLEHMAESAPLKPSPLESPPWIARQPRYQTGPQYQSGPPREQQWPQQQIPQGGQPGAPQPQGQQLPVQQSPAERLPADQPLVFPVISGQPESAQAPAITQ